MTGEETQAKGADGARRAKIWLDSTTRANTQWVNPQPVAVRKLKFSWALENRNFSFDLGGILLGGDMDGEEFLAESKKYYRALDQAGHYKKFLAQCYRALELRPDRCDNFMYITWSPFSSDKWDELTKEAKVRSSVLEYRHLALGLEDEKEAGSAISKELCKDVAERLWIIVLSDRQEKHLRPTQEHLAIIRKHETERGFQ
ncbi:hypothetical protein FPZ12_006855 [Amycolatopsis acidicola]|uniref:Uncharacterized protein n=1 Tax=Amycolatopsis acidicola TaxID=2596893 RepID=A0A5N0VHP9_9PSEU|nr:hypothetical protein [Amycolatopsis acidicola]KAA9164964.1 hypothetical protein FPZ12_006855 [Amycolatopsis acidicola]